MLSFRQAFIVSLTIHLMLLPGMGWLAGGWLKASPVISQLIELELATAGEPGSGIGTAAAAESTERAQTASTPILAPTPAMPALPLEDFATPAVASNAESQPTQQANSTLHGSTSGDALGNNQTRSNSNGGSGAGSGTSGDSGATGGSTTSPSVILPPRVLKSQEPKYPMSARRANQEGVVRLRIEIMPNGAPGIISIADSSGYPALDNAAEAAVHNWKFIPACDKKSGAPVASVTVLSVAFRLR